ncbi:hypothetical protein C8R46DRAFT_913635, partial [Mycena filopes]
RLLAEPATFPALPSLTLVSPYLPWVITAHAESGWVVVGDVLRAIQEALQMRIDEEWQEEMVKDGDLRRSSPDVSTGARWRGRAITRMDLLQGRTRFGGLVESTMGCDVWTVNFL